MTPHQRAALVQTALEGVPLPAEKRDLVAYAWRTGLPHAVVAALAELPDRSYDRLDDVGEALLPAELVPAGD